MIVTNYAVTRGYTGDDGGITKHFGELRDVVTGAVVVVPDCPF